LFLPNSTSVIVYVKTSNILVKTGYIEMKYSPYYDTYSEIHLDSFIKAGLCQKYRNIEKDESPTEEKGVKIKYNNQITQYIFGFFSLY
jgi:hypothetical protein